MSSYEDVKKVIFDKLKKADNIDINAEIKNLKQALLVPETTQYLLGTTDISLTIDWERMQTELETQFNVKMDHGILIKDTGQQDRDITWWTGKAQQECDSYYWNRYEEHLRESLPPEVVRTIDTDTDVSMNNIENPNVNNFDRRGMVVGHVQSGKTGNYAGLICKAADAGYKFIVVIAGGINNLRNQTQERLNEAFIGKDGGTQVGVGVGNAQNDKLPISLTTKEKDFNKQDADRNKQGTNFENNIVPIILVVKKNTNTLKNVIDWLNKTYPDGVKEHAMLMIDDESDYASINTKDEEDPTTINTRLRELLAIFQKSAYVAYTATPYANIFIDHEAGHEQYEYDLFPKDFIYALNAPTNYFGAREIFLDTDKKYLVPVDDYQDVIPAKHKKDFALHAIPESLYRAIRVFLLNIAIRNLRGQGDKHNSMLIHITRFTAVHQKLAFHVDQYIETLKKDVMTYGKLPDANQQSIPIQILQDTLTAVYPDIEFTWSDILNCLCDVIKGVVIREAHQQTKIPLEYRKDTATNAIVIGGTSLSRGYTLEGLSVSYFLRNTVFYDTLMQMGRWFGYREGYQDICRIYMPETMINNFGHIIEATEDLIEDFKKMRDEDMTPKDFGLAVRQHPDSLLQITARNKQRNVTDFIHSMRLDGHAKETAWLSNDESIKKNNLAVIENTINELQTNYPHEKIGNNYLWRSIDKASIVDFLSEFKVYQNDVFGISSRMPIEFIKKYAQDIDIKWDVALYSGSGEDENIGAIKIGKEQRKTTNDDPNDNRLEITNRQVSTGSSEAIALPPEDRKELGSNRKKAREMLEHPLLMLHILQTKKDERLAAFGVSFPSRIVSDTQDITLTVNTVYSQQILLDLNYENGADD